MQGKPRKWHALLFLACAMATAQANADTARKEAQPDCLAGFYDGGQTEIAAGLELSADGRFRYALSYGALDEQAQGEWQSDSASVYLTSDPVAPPRFALVGEEPSRDGALHIRLDLPQGISPQYFDAQLLFADGSSVTHQMGEDGLTLRLEPADRPVSVSVLLPLFGLQSQAFALSGGRERTISIRFDPNDIGKTAFAQTPLRREKGALLLERHGRLLRFTPEHGGCTASREK